MKVKDYPWNILRYNSDKECDLEVELLVKYKDGKIEKNTCWLDCYDDEFFMKPVENFEIVDLKITISGGGCNCDEYVIMTYEVKEI